MENKTINIGIVEKVAIALQELKDKMVFVGGAVISLYTDDPAADEPSTCAPEYYEAPNSINNFGNVLRLYNLNASSSYVSGNTVLEISANTNKAHVNSLYSPLYLNSCGQNIYMLGAKLGFGTSAPQEKFHFSSGNILLDNTAFANPTNQPALKVKANLFTGSYIETNHNVDFGFNSILSVNRANTKAFTIINTNPSVTGDYFQVMGDGRTAIGKNMLSGNGSMLTVGQPNVNALALSLVNNNSSTTQDFFNVYGNGYTEIKVYNPTNMPQPPGGSPRAFTVKDMANNKDLFVINANGKTYAREVEITLVNTFPDYVFSNDYKLKSIDQVEDYIKQNKHLPGFEKAEYYEKNGINVNEMFIKQQEKIEELTLYIIELKKEIDNIKKNNN